MGEAKQIEAEAAGYGADQESVGYWFTPDDIEPWPSPEELAADAPLHQEDCRCSLCSAES